MVHIAHEEGFAVMSHTNGVYGVQAALEAGVDSLEHGNYMDEECISMLADSQTIWVPTLVTVRNLRGCGRYADEILTPIIKSVEESLRLAFQKRHRQLLGAMPVPIWFLMGEGFWKSMNPFARYWERILL